MPPWPWRLRKADVYLIGRRLNKFELVAANCGEGPFRVTQE